MVGTEMTVKLDYVPVYCLRHEQLVQASYPRDVMGALFNCPLCGKITEKVENSWHVFDPSKPLIARLQGTAPINVEWSTND